MNISQIIIPTFAVLNGFNLAGLGGANVPLQDC